MWCGSDVLKPLVQHILNETQADQKGFLNYATEWMYRKNCILCTGLTEKLILCLQNAQITILIIIDFHSPNNLKIVK